MNGLIARISDSWYGFIRYYDTMTVARDKNDLVVYTIEESKDNKKVIEIRVGGFHGESMSI